MNIKKIASLIVAATAWSGSAQAYQATASVVLDIGGNGGGIGVPSLPFPANPTADLVWTSGGSGGQLYNVANGTYFSNLNGYNGINYYNQDFATAAMCTGIYGPSATTRRYGCRFDTGYGSAFVATPFNDSGPVGRATGTLSVTDTTLTGTLQIVGSTDEPTGATLTGVTSTGARISNDAGKGSNGYNYRAADGSPFGNYWLGVSTQGAFEFSLTGTFTSTQWFINGGTVRFTDPGLLCQQGGFGGTDSAAGQLCTRSFNSGGQQNNGQNLSWGWDLDGSGASTTISEIEVRDPSGSVVLSRLSGVLASLSIDPSTGNIVTNAGEFRRANDPALGCGGAVRWDGSKMTCGTLVAGRLNFVGTVSEVPLPAGLWLFATAAATLALRARRRAVATP